MDTNRPHDDTAPSAPDVPGDGDEFLIAVLTHRTVFVSGAEGPHQRRYVLAPGTHVAVGVDALLAPGDLVRVHRLTGDGTPGRADARVPRTRLRVP